ncbi:MAG: ribonuclease D [Alphaproteobacteria bacterium]|nr:ribonuclease D [Alphaproteobacteria bacterium]MBQ3116862.1 ribonuclease D [Alphaproteobacteria bacterium]MBQ6855374.1 ribonuclease D [Alphaproteobacteria bacterium]MBR3912686.1 ribonuclease D [Alphaproteobacteria bacterium]
MAEITVYKGDLPDTVYFKDAVAVDTETMGLNLHRDRLCLVQLSAGDGTAVLVQIQKGVDCPNLKRLMQDKSVLKIFHFARFDVAKILNDLGVVVTPVYCTKIASKLCRTSSPSHSLKSLCNDLLGIVLQKEQQTSDWGAETLNQAQQEYAANDVLYLHRLKEILDALLVREGRFELALSCFDFLPTRAKLDLADFAEPDIFAH